MVLSCSAVHGKSRLDKRPHACAFSSPSTAPCFCKCQDCSLLPVWEEAQRWHAVKQLLTLVTLLLLTGLEIATRHFVASGIGKKNYEMVLHERGSTGACLCNIQR